MTREVFNPLALATAGDVELDARPHVQDVDGDMILAFVLDVNELPPYSARPFAEWAHNNWGGDWNPDGTMTNGEMLTGMLSDWCGGRVLPTT